MQQIHEIFLPFCLILLDQGPAQNPWSTASECLGDRFERQTRLQIQPV